MGGGGLVVGSHGGVGTFELLAVMFVNDVLHNMHSRCVFCHVTLNIEQYICPCYMSEAASHYVQLSS